MRYIKLIPVGAAIVLLVACGGGSSGAGMSGNGRTTGPSAADAGTVSGIVTDSKGGGRLSNVTVSGAGKSTTTNAKGEYTLSGLSTGTVAVSFSLADYAPGYGNATIGAVGEPLLIKLKKMAPSQGYDNNSSKTISQSTEAGPYAVIFQPGSLNTNDANLQVSVTPLDPTLEAATLPGELATSDALLLPLTFAEFSILDSHGTRVNTVANLAQGKEPVVELPIPPTLRKLAAYAVDAATPKTIHCYSYNPVTGQWEDFVEGKIVLSSVDHITPVVRAAIKHFSWYGAAPETNDCVKIYGRVVSAVDGKPLPDARVEAFPGGTTRSDSNGDFELITSTQNTSPHIVATRTYTDVDGSVSGMKGAKVIEFGKEDDIPLVGLVKVNCKTGTVVGPIGAPKIAANGLTPRVKGTASERLPVRIGKLSNLSYEVTAFLTAGDAESGAVNVVINQVLPDGASSEDTRVLDARVWITGPDGVRTPVPDPGAALGFKTGIYIANLTITPGKRYTLEIDADGNGSIDGSGSASAVGDLTWVGPANGSTTTSTVDLDIAWADSATAANNPNYSAVYYAWVIRNPSGPNDVQYDVAFYLGTQSHVRIGNIHNNTPLLPGTYTTHLMAFSGPAPGASAGLNSNFSLVNNISGANVSGQFYSFAASTNDAAATFTLE